MSSPPRRKKPRVDESHLPRGGCKFILHCPEAKHLRCACAGFARNRSIPGSSCDCGHQAVYHTPKIEELDRQEIEALRLRVSVLEKELDRERSIGRGGLIDRLSRLEELVDKSNSEHEVELKGVYRGIGGVWQHVGLIEKRMPYYDDRIDSLVDDVHRMSARLIEVDDASMRVEDRVDAIERGSPLASYRSQRRETSTPPTSNDESAPETLTSSENSLSSDPTTPVKESNALRRDSWTVHISLMPNPSQPFPFEKDTVAYKRCLSRGLHRKIVVPDAGAQSFKHAVNTAFAPILRGRPWQPLVAKICDAENLRGLPMLRQLPNTLVNSDYDVEFLKSNCAILDMRGRIEDLYIAMIGDVISWAELYELESFIPGLELAWVHDAKLDGQYTNKTTRSDGIDKVRLESEKRLGGDTFDSFSTIEISPSRGANPKRQASWISQTPSFDSSTDETNHRAKLRRCTDVAVEIVGRSAGTV